MRTRCSNMTNCYSRGKKPPKPSAKLEPIIQINQAGEKGTIYC